jgi:hypothetical protein
MFFSLTKVNTHPLYQVQEALKSFFVHCVTADGFDMSCFPAWFQKALNRPPRTLKNLFEEIAGIIQGYNQPDRKHILEVFNRANEVERLCGDKRLKPKSSLEKMPELEMKLKELFEYLYENTLERKKLFTGITDSSIRNHFQLFRDSNSVCPFCGIEAYPDRNGGTRANYDHYLDRIRYFFASVNFSNLVPMCHLCNTSYKGGKDILYLQSSRRVAFYPYATLKGVAVQIACNKKPSIVDKLGDWEVSLKPESKKDLDRVTTWIDVFSITLRLGARIQEKNERWMMEFIARRFAETRCEGKQLRKALSVESNRLAKNIKSEREAVIEAAYMQYLASEADDAEIDGYCGVAASDYNAQMSQVGANLAN